MPCRPDSRAAEGGSAPRRAVVLGLLLPAALAGGVLTPAPAYAHEQPEGANAEWLMADWMLLSFLVFFLAALVVFVVAVRRGMFRDLEGAKYHLLTIDEPDYYTPGWAREDADAAPRGDAGRY